jgi:anti-sigma B factor antagonist
VNTVGSVAKVFKMTGMDSHLEIFDTEEAAIKSFKK